MSPTSRALLITLIVVALAAPVIVGGMWWRRRHNPAPAAPRRAATMFGVVCLVVVGQLAALSAAVVEVNRQFDYFLDWNSVRAAFADGPGGLAANLGLGGDPGSLHLDRS